MKKLLLAISMVSLSTFGQTPAPKRTVTVREPQAQKSTKTTVVTTSPTYSSSPSNVRIGLGFATWGSTTPVGNGHSISAMIEFSDLMSLQPFFAINGSSPFTFAVGSVLRYTVHGGGDNGFHAGLGFNLGTSGTTTTTFFLNIFPVAGYHFSLGGHVSNIKLAFDMGPMFEITPTFQFRAIPIGAVGGASLHYMF